VLNVPVISVNASLGGIHHHTMRSTVSQHNVTSNVSLFFTVALHIAGGEFLGNRNNSNVDAKKEHAMRELQTTDRLRQSRKVLNRSHRLLPQISSLVSFNGRLTTRNNRDRWSPGGARRQPFDALALPTWLAPAA